MDIKSIRLIHSTPPELIKKDSDNPTKHNTKTLKYNNKVAKVLLFISNNPGVCFKKLIEITKISKATMHIVIKELFSKEMITKTILPGQGRKISFNIK